MKRRFRQFVGLGLFLTIVVESVAWFYLPSNSVLADLMATDGYAAVIAGGLPLYVLIVVARILIMIGLLSFHPMARLLFLSYMLILIGLSMFWGYRVTAPIQAPFLLLESIVDGVILALAYYSSVSREFTNPSIQNTG